MTDTTPQELGINEFLPGQEYVLENGPFHHKFVYEGSGDLTGGIPSREFFMPRIQIGDLSAFAEAGQSFSKEIAEVYLKYGPDDGIKKYLHEIIDHGVILPTSKTEIIAAYGYHAAANIYIDQSGKVIDKIKDAKEKGSLGGGEKRVAYFSTEFDRALGHGLGDLNRILTNKPDLTGVRILMATIDIGSLRRKRNIFVDPESLTPAYFEEFGKNFVVHQGFPLSAMRKIGIFRYEGYEEK